MAVSYTGKYRAIVYSGYSTMAIGCGLLSTVNNKTHKVPLVVYMILTGIGVGQVRTSHLRVMLYVSEIISLDDADNYGSGSSKRPSERHVRRDRGAKCAY